MLMLDEDQVRRVADPDTVVEAMRAAFARDFFLTLRMPVRSCLPLCDGGVLLIMPAYDRSVGLAGVKTVAVTKASGVSAVYELIDPVRGQVLMRAEAKWLTDVRTAATSAVATGLMAPPDPQVLGIFGAGRQAEAHIAVLSRVRRFTRVLVCGSPGSDVRPFCRRIEERYHLEVIPAQAEACVRDADVVCTCTTSAVPVFDGGWLKPGMHVNVVGAFQPTTREVDDETVRRSRIVVDTYEGALAEAGDLLIPMSRGVIGREHIAADLHEIASGKRPARTSADEITLFKSVGCALEDLVTAKLIYDRAGA
jgi:ornithine cyclodeaminase/alanine dehydrogenase-like protein (mu-crystallin family)